MVMSGITESRCFVFLDDIVVYEKSLADHDEIRQVFDRIRESNLRLKPEKCEFLRKEFSYMRHVISEKAVLPYKTKKKATGEFPTPQTVKKLKHFLGLMSYYRHFRPRFSTLASRLHKLLKKFTRHDLTDEQEHAFRGLKNKLISPPILRYPK